MTTYTRQIHVTEFEEMKNALESIGHPILGWTAVPGQPWLCTISFGDVATEIHLDHCDHRIEDATHDRDLPVAVGGVA